MDFKTIIVGYYNLNAYPNENNQQGNFRTDTSDGLTRHV
jgi:hypothetical protein